MNKPAKPEAQPVSASVSDAETDAWIDRNRDALEVMVAEAWEEIDRGEFDERGFDEIAAQGVIRRNAKR